MNSKIPRFGEKPKKTVRLIDSPVVVAKRARLVDSPKLPATSARQKAARRSINRAKNLITNKKKATLTSNELAKKKKLPIKAIPPIKKPMRPVLKATSRSINTRAAPPPRSMSLAPISSRSATVLEKQSKTGALSLAPTSSTRTQFIPPKKPARKAWDTKGKLEDAKEDIAFYKKQLKQFESYGELVHDLEKKNFENEQMTKSNIKQEAEIQELQEKVKRFNSDHQQIIHDLSTEKAKCTELTKIRADLSQNLEETMTELIQTKEKLNEEEKENIKFLAEISEKNKKMENLECNILNLTDEKKRLETNNCALTKKLAEEEKENAKNITDISEYKIKLGQMEENFEKLNSDYHQLEVNNCGLTKKLSEEEKDNRRNLQKISENCIKIEELEKNIFSLTNEHLKMENNNCELTRKLDKVSNEKDDLESRHEALLAEDQRKNDQIQKMEQERRKLNNMVQELKGNIRVYCRVRPLLKSEQTEANNGAKHIMFDEEDDKALEICEDNKKEFKFEFDRVFNMHSTQSQVFDDVSQLVQSSLDGYNVCIFAYGQTGAGKTYTMDGCDDDAELGIIPRSIRMIFEQVEYLKKFGWEYELTVQQVQIYMEQLMDLLPGGSDKLEIKTANESGEKKVWVKGLSQHKITNFDQVMKLIEHSKKKRKTAQTHANEVSSRSHSVFTLHINAENIKKGQQHQSALNLIDLAGSERCSQAKTSGQRLKEAQKINSSLAELTNVITALANKATHVPYRNSKLTLLLKDSLGGSSSKTLMFVNINPSKASTNESLNTLRFATTVNKCSIGTARKTVKF